MVGGGWEAGVFDLGVKVPTNLLSISNACTPVSLSIVFPPYQHKFKTHDLNQVHTPAFCRRPFPVVPIHHPATAQQPVMVSYTPSAADFVNPERGFMRFTETTSGDYIPLSPNQMASWRTLHLPGGDPAAEYAIFASLVYRGFYLESFVNGPISTAYLTAMQEDFDAARLAGVKLIVRFAYTQETTPPYGDAPKHIVLQHIAQLKPLLLANSDVIATLQMGFIGAWGEGYYTDHFGFGSLSAQNWADRTDVLNALLDACPPTGRFLCGIHK